MDDFTISRSCSTLEYIKTGITILSDSESCKSLFLPLSMSQSRPMANAAFIPRPTKRNISCARWTNTSYLFVKMSRTTSIVLVHICHNINFATYSVNYDLIHLYTKIHVQSTPKCSNICCKFTLHFHSIGAQLISVKSIAREFNNILAKHLLV